MVEEKNLYYVDFVRSGGVISTQPTRSIPELVVIGRVKSELEKQLEEYFEGIKINLAGAARLGRAIQGTHRFARGKLFELILPSPGLIGLENNFYTGWFYAVKDNQVFPATWKRKGDETPKYEFSNSFRPYFLLDEKNAERWNLRFKSPLTLEEIESLRSLPHEDSHPLHQHLGSLSLENYLTITRSFVDNFWTTVRELLDENSEGVSEYIKMHLLRIAIADHVGEKLYKNALLEIKDQMRGRFTVFPLNENFCVVAYKVRDTRENGRLRYRTKYRTLRLPHTHIRNFQRYPILGEELMTSDELEHWYTKLVDPTTELFRRN